VIYFLRYYFIPICLCLTVFYNSALAQEKTLIFNFQETSRTVICDSTEIEKTLSREMIAFVNQGYLTSSFELSSLKSDTIEAIIDLGNQYEFAYLSKGNVHEGVLSRINFRDKIYNNKPFKRTDVSALLERILIWSENNGYPFASVKLDSIIINENKISASLNHNLGDFFANDSLIIKGDSKTSEVFFRNYLGLKKDAPYNEKMISKMDARLRELSFIRVREGSKVLFTPGKADTYLFIDDQNASNINGIAGILPNEITGQIDITLDAKIRLRNALKRGELINLNWRRLPSQSQDLNVHFTYPYLLKSPFGIDTDFSLFRRDTSFVEINMNLGVLYQFVGENYIKVFANNYQSNLINQPLIEDQNSGNVSLTSFGIELNYENLDYRFNPRKGIAWRFTSSAGNKDVRKDALTQEETSTQFVFANLFQAFIPLSKKSIIMLGSNGSMIVNDNIQFNELYRIGGIHSLRGFDEATIMASMFNVFTMEYRFLLDRNSNLYLFYDYAYYENRARKDFLKDTPSGFGAGISFETGQGIFSVNYALGQQFDNPVSFRAAKLHFGFVNMF
jgi:outer membrane protein assembly factor BamA